ncbi:MAG: M24 family metallopeptidase [Ignavibacteriales bacterium]|nr:M24 family metallopeptidase [Ignavibacteriales bacterium]
MANFNLSKVQELLLKQKVDGWLLFDFRGSNELALNILDIGPHAHLTRRFFYFIPAIGEPQKIVNGIEAHNLAHLPGKERKYSSFISLKENLTEVLAGVNKVAMEYSPLNAIPYLSKVDAGTLEFLKTFNIEIVSSGDLITLFDAIWTKEQYEENIPVGKALTDIVEECWKLIRKEITTGNKITEYDVQQFILNEFTKRNYITDSDPIVAVNENSANPHYSPDSTTFKEIKKDDFVLIDLWAKPNKPSGVWSDITWVGYVGGEIPEKYIKIFNIVKESRDAGFDFVSNRFDAKQPVMAFEVDDISRGVIEKAGYGKWFIHRTGHSITTGLHGSGPHLDNFETHDERLLLPSTSFSIEPGIYLTGDFGVRSEIDVYIHPDGTVEQTGGPRQQEIKAILK